MRKNYLISSYPALYAKCDKEKKVILYVYLFKKCKQKNEMFQCFDSPGTSFQLKSDIKEALEIGKKQMRQENTEKISESGNHGFD